MNRYCYTSVILPGMTEKIRNHWRGKPANEEGVDLFWEALQMTGFEAWIQGNRLVHCLEGNSLEGIFSGLRQQIAAQNRIALKLQRFYQEVIGRDYSDPAIMPQIECLTDIQLPGGNAVEKRGRCFPVLPDKIEAHRTFSATCDNSWLPAFGITRFTKWLQTTDEGPFLVIYTEHDRILGPDRLKEAAAYPAWREVAAISSEHTGLPQDQLSPDIEWVTGSS